jgi:hypothetical protein
VFVSATPTYTVTHNLLLKPRGVCMALGLAPYAGAHLSLVVTDAGVGFGSSVLRVDVLGLKEARVTTLDAGAEFGAAHDIAPFGAGRFLITDPVGNRVLLWDAAAAR